MASTKHLFAVLESMATPDVAALLLAARPGVTRHDVAALTGESADDVARRLRAGLLLVRARLEAEALGDAGSRAAEGVSWLPRSRPVEPASAPRSLAPDG